MASAQSSTRSRRSGISTSGAGYAVTAYAIWGLTPIYWKGITSIAAAEVLVPRILWTAGLMVGVCWLSGRRREVLQQGASSWAANLGAASLLAVNWGVFIYAVQSDQVIATSLGYYINPLMSILLGLLILRERLNPTQAFAIAFAILGVAIMTLRAGELPWISLVLASSFALYGLAHKLWPQPALAGLTREMMILTPVASFGWLFVSSRMDTRLATLDWGEHAYLSLTSVVTAAPLLTFHAATRRLPLVAVGMFQYIAPTLTLLLATLVWNEPFTTAHTTGFGCVWIGLVIFSWDSLRRARAISVRATPKP